MKPTRATVKKFVKTWNGNLLISTKSSFDGMTDCVQQCPDRGFTSIRAPLNSHPEHDLGIAGFWFVGGGRDYIENLKLPGYLGYSVSNCCGSFEIAVRM